MNKHTLIAQINTLCDKAECDKADHAINSIDVMCEEWEAMGFPLVIVDRARFEAKRRLESIPTKQRPFVTQRMMRIASKLR